MRPRYSPFNFVRRFFVFCFFLLALPGCLFARLGDYSDTIEDVDGGLVARKLQDDGTVGIFYHKDHYLYFVIFDRDTSISERYSRFDGKDLSQNEITRFLRGNAGRAMTWHPVAASASEERNFERSDHKAEATVARVVDRLVLTVRRIGGK